MKPTTYTIHTDGACKGNPGPAGIAYTIQDDRGETLFWRAEFIGTATNNIAEYRALISALHEAAGRGCANVTIYTDSQLMARQVTGEYQTRNAVLKELRDEVRRMFGKFERAEIAYVKREANKEADRLASGIVKQHLSSRRNRKR